MKKNIYIYVYIISSVQFSTQSCPTLCNPMDYSTPGVPVHHQLPELAQTHVCRVSDATQPSHPLSSPSPLTLNLSQHQGIDNIYNKKEYIYIYIYIYVLYIFYISYSQLS